MRLYAAFTGGKTPIRSGSGTPLKVCDIRYKKYSRTDLKVKRRLKITMEKINRSLRTHFVFALTWSVLMVAGVPLIVFGASKPGWLPVPTLFFVLGIIFSGGGFYGVPLLWISYGNKRELRGLVYAVEVLGLRDVARIASHLRKPEDDVRTKLDVCFSKGYFPTLIREGDRITEAAPAIPPENELHDVVCPCCSAHFSYRGTRGVCPYCGVAYSGDKK